MYVVTLSPSDASVGYVYVVTLPPSDASVIYVNVVTLLPSDASIGYVYVVTLPSSDRVDSSYDEFFWTWQFYSTYFGRDGPTKSVKVRR